MTDDLVARLRKVGGSGAHPITAMYLEAASSLEAAEARVRELEAQLATVRAECAKTSNSYLARAETAESALAEEVQYLAFFERHPGMELSCSWDVEDGPWQVYRVTGGRNDREWRKFAQGATPREAIAAAIRQLAQVKHEAE